MGDDHHASTPSTSDSTFVKPTLAQTIERTTKYKPDFTRKREIDYCVLNMVVADMEPLAVIERKGFWILLETLDPKYEESD